MSRPLRLEFAGALYHVTSRGNERKELFRHKDDFAAFIDLLREVCTRFHWVIHSYCLMINHYHLLVETPDGNLSKGMRQLNGVYTQRFNRKYNRVGHLYQGRYKSILVDKDSYLLELSRYIVLNPVRAKGMVDSPDKWLWSSYQETLGKRASPDWLATDALLLMFARDRQVAIAKYIEFVAQGKGVDIWQHLKSQVFMGSNEFVKMHQENASVETDASQSEVPKKQKHLQVQPIDWYKDNYRSDKKRAMAAAYLDGQYTMNEIAQAFDVHYSTVSRAVAQCKT
ncbi:transposase [Pseudoalteromonas sp. OOF1S-7]|uniref:transposase n=1 Tax=Pseudoalteromonas sp. OOF1S-7 TaxID=2917757 RepID=UPI001EF3FD09|nr:transposase [Pseudoalteromonas sp. OOF1S-7]MCG7534148.1 transposase [Pseudoalteromonas sp. OOF1S-7]